jgi:YD repeat-containing protein
MRTIAVLFVWMAVAAGQTVSIPLVIQMSCDATYSETTTTGSLSGRCSGLVQPYGMATMTLSMGGKVSEKNPVTAIGGSFAFAFSGGMGFEAVVDGAQAQPSGKSGMTVLVAASIRQGSGTMAGAGGQLTMALDGVSEKEGTARVAVNGTGTVTAPALKPGPAVPAGPGTLGETLETGGAACGDPVAVTNGNMYHRFVDLVAAGRTFPISLVRTYNSQAAAVDGPFGYGWTHSYREALRAAGTSMVLESGSGSAIVLAAAGSGFSSSSAPGLKLAREGTGYSLRAEDGTVRKFDAAGKLASMADANGNGQTYAYDSAGRLLTISDGAGAVVTFSYNGAGRIAAVQDHAGRRASYEYDGSGNLLAATGNGQPRTAFEYTDHVMRKMTPAGEGAILFSYGTDGKTAENTRQDGARVEFQYGAGKTTLQEDAGVVTYEFNAAGQITRSVQPDGGAKMQNWNGAGRIESVVDELGYRTTYTHDAAGRVLTKTDALGNTMRFGYDAVSGKLKWFTDAAGNLTEYGYDDKGNRIWLRNPLGEEKRMRYDARGQLVEQTEADGSVVQSVFDEAGNVVQQSDAAGVVWKARYDNLRRLVSMTGPEGNEKKFEWDAGGRPVKVTDPVLGVTTRSFDSSGRLLKMSGPGQPATEYTYDQAGRLAAVKDALGKVFRYEYHAGGKLAATVDPLGGRTAQEYDAAGRITAETTADGKTRKWGWNARGDMVSQTIEDGRTVRMEYDALRRLIKRVGAGGEEEAFVYDERGNTVQASNENVTLYYAYDALNRVTSVTDSRGPFTISYTYDSGGRRKTMTDPGGGITTYEYDAAGRLTAVTDPAGREYRFEYGADRQRSRTIYAGGVVAAYGYDAAGRPNRISYGTTVVYTGEFDSSGNRTVLSGPEGTHTFEYDALNRIVAATHPTLPAETFRYDAAGRREDIRESPLRKELDGLGRLRSAETPGGERVVYRYDPYGRLIEREAEGVVTLYVFDGERMLLELDGQGAVAARRTYAGVEGDALEDERADGVYQYLIDLAGNVGTVAKPAAAGPSAVGKGRSAGDEFPPEPTDPLPQEYTVYGEVTEPENPAVGGFLGARQGLLDSVTKLMPMAGTMFEPVRGLLGGLSGGFGSLMAGVMAGVMAHFGNAGGALGMGAVVGQAMGAPTQVPVAGLLGGADPLSQAGGPMGLGSYQALAGLTLSPLGQAYLAFSSQTGGTAFPSLSNSAMQSMLSSAAGGVIGSGPLSFSNIGSITNLVSNMTGSPQLPSIGNLLQGNASCSAPVPGVATGLLQVLSGQQGEVENELLRPSGPDIMHLQQLQTSVGQTYKMLTNLMKSDHDTVMSIIGRNIAP